MNRWIRTVAAPTTLAGALALVPSGLAFAQQAPSSEAGATGHHHHPKGLLGEALKLDSLTADQRSAIEGLMAQHHAAEVQVRAADTQVLTTLAHQVEQAAIDPQALAPAIASEDQAALAASTAEREALNHLHSILSPAQRDDVVGRLLADHPRMHGGSPDAGPEGRHPGGRLAKELGLSADQQAKITANLRAEWQADGGPRDHGQRGEHRQALDAFRGEAFDASALVKVEHRGERAEKLATAIVPILTPAQRATFAGELRQGPAWARWEKRGG